MSRLQDIIRMELCVKTFEVERVVFSGLLWWLPKSSKVFNCMTFVLGSLHKLRLHFLAFDHVPTLG